VYWATGLTPVYLEGALVRARHSSHTSVRRPPDPHFDEPAPAPQADAPPADSVLNPFSVYRKGEVLLRRQLAALSAWHLVNIIRDYRLSDSSAATLSALQPADLIDLIVTAVQVRSEVPAAR
jgi:hypothetical protein